MIIIIIKINAMVYYLYHGRSTTNTYNIIARISCDAKVDVQPKGIQAQFSRPGVSLNSAGLRSGAGENDEISFHQSTRSRRPEIGHSIVLKFDLCPTS